MESWKIFKLLQDILLEEEPLVKFDVNYFKK